MEILKYEKFNESYFSNVSDYYKIFGLKSLLTKPFVGDITNIKKSSKHLVRYNKLDTTEVLSIIKQVVDFYYDEKDIKFIGHGFYGSVYQSSDETKVLKITTDPKEVKRAEKFRKINTDCVVDYYDVREIEIYRDNEKVNIKLWALIIEKVKPLNNFEKSLWRKQFESVIQNDINPYDKISDFKIDNKFFNSDGTIDENIPKDIYDVCSKFLDLVNKMIKISKKYNITFNDLHEDNIGKTTNGEYKFFDIRSTGYSSPKLPLKPIVVNL